MSKKNDIRLSKRENHRLPDSGVRGLLNQLKKEEKNKDSKSLVILNAKISASAHMLNSLIWVSVMGVIATQIFPSLNAAPYWIAIFLTTSVIDLWTLSYQKVSREDYIPSWKEKDGK